MTVYALADLAGLRISGQELRPALGPMNRTVADADRILDQYYATVTFDNGSKFSLNEWSNWLAEDYFYVDQNGKTFLTKEDARLTLEAVFASFETLKPTATPIGSKNFGSAGKTIVCDMHIEAGTGGRVLTVDTTILLDFMRSKEGWKLSNEVVVANSGH